VIEGTSRLSNIAQRYEGGAMYAELIIANYDTTEQAQQYIQLTLLDDFDDRNRILNERMIISNG